LERDAEYWGIVMREIYTYANPLLMNKDEIIWKMVKQYPQFCASDTLSQGMIQFYGRKEFGIIRSMSNLQKTLVGSVTDDTQFDMQLFLDISHELKEIVCNQEIKNSFRNDLSEIVQSVKYLLFLDALPDKLFQIDNISDEQRALFCIYEKIYQKYNHEIETLMNKNREDIDDLIRKTVIYEAEYILSSMNDNVADEDYQCKDLANALEKLTALQKNLCKKIECRYEVEFNNTAKEKKKLERVEYVIDLISRLDSVDVSTIIIHGVHKFTPEILLVLRLLEKQGINVIFLIHYVDKLPQIYGTWKEVYSWTKEDFKNVHPFDINAGSLAGKELAKIYGGRLSSEKLNAYKVSYENLSEFAVGEVRRTFNHAENKLDKMKVQYYAVDNTDSNEILKNYFPEQFKKKPFLSYPIGQFVLGIYNMWDFEKSYMRYVPESLRECVYSGIFEKDALNNVGAIYDDLALYIAGLDSISDVLERLNHLINEKKIIEKYKKDLGGLQAICYFSRDIKDVEKLIEYLKRLIKLSNSIFVQENDQISFNTHFRNLMEVLAGTVNNSALVQKSEIQLVQEILGALKKQTRKDVVGDFPDVREALTFFLHQSEGDDSSNWIVRNFEQLDGAVLLADHSKAREYHFALLSMKNMTRNAKKELPWPLSEELFYGYDCQIESSIQACALSNAERANFLKYSLFYAVFFFKKRITFSYIVNQNDEKQRAYYLFDLLKLKDKKETINADINFAGISPKTEEKVFDYSSLTIEQKEMFAICRYKYFLNRVLNESIIYKSDFQIKYYLQNFLVQVVLEKENLTINNYTHEVKKYVKRFQQFFPNLDNIFFADMERKVLQEVLNSLEFSIKNHKSTHKQQDWYKRRKKNFLLAQWIENGSNEMDFNNISPNNVVDYMINNDILLSENDRPHVKVCENCNYSSDCLMNYFEGLRKKEIEV